MGVEYFDMKKLEMLVISLSGVKSRICSHISCSGPNALFLAVNVS